MSRLEMLQSFIQSNPGDPFPRYGLAMELKNSGRLDEANAAFTELTTRFPDYTAAYLHAGNTLRELGRPQEAVAVYRHGIDACTKKRDLHAKGELEAALADLEQLGPGERS
jgi:tetratricopeptide (TPR) repeat protein